MMPKLGVRVKAKAGRSVVWLVILLRATMLLLCPKCRGLTGL